jgi:hypothetical protein
MMPLKRREGRHLRMLGLLLLFLIVCTALGYAWLYFVTPQQDLDRIKADQGGTGALAFTIKRMGTKYIDGKHVWVADNPLTIGGLGFCRIYDVTVERAGGALEKYSIAVEASLFGESQVMRIDPPRAGD